MKIISLVMVSWFLELCVTICLLRTFPPAAESLKIYDYKKKNNNYNVNSSKKERKNEKYVVLSVLSFKKWENIFFWIYILGYLNLYYKLVSGN